ncbi:MAG: tetratricopeptide repeat-containing glycosyltransferase family protein [Betaproteobacteria bacterium]
MLPPARKQLFETGNAHMNAGRFVEAAVAYSRALKLQPGARTHGNLGVALAEQGLYEAAVLHYQEALRLEPTHAEAAYNWGNALCALTRYAEAVTCYDRALAANPEWSPALLNRGLAFAAQGKQKLAEESYRRALAANPDYAEALNNLGLALQLQGHFEAAMARFNRAIELSPELANAHANRAQLRLLLGDLRNGFSEYEWRWRLAGVGLPAINVPGWDGAAMSGRTVLLRAEQGFGDTIQFVRFAQVLRQAGAKVVIECPAVLERLLSTTRGVSQVVVRGKPLPKCDVQIPVASLPAVLNVFEIGAIPAAIPYLFTDPGRVAHWRRRLAAHAGFRIGVAWRGSTGHPQDPHRSFSASQFAVLATLPGVCLVNLQIGERMPDGLPAIDLLEQRALDTFAFADTAAIVANLDLVITCDTALAHLCGALGVPVWIALSLAPDWRWLLNRDDSPWYPTARLFRQKHLDDWRSVFRHIALSLARHIATNTRR